MSAGETAHAIVGEGFAERGIGLVNSGIEDVPQGEQQGPLVSFPPLETSEGWATYLYFSASPAGGFDDAN